MCPRRHVCVPNVVTLAPPRWCGRRPPAEQAVPPRGWFQGAWAPEKSTTSFGCWVPLPAAAPTSSPRWPPVVSVSPCRLPADPAPVSLGGGVGWGARSPMAVPVIQTGVSWVPVASEWGPMGACGSKMGSQGCLWLRNGRIQGSMWLLWVPAAPKWAAQGCLQLLWVPVAEKWGSHGCLWFQNGSPRHPCGSHGCLQL